MESLRGYWRRKSYVRLDSGEPTSSAERRRRRRNTRVEITTLEAAAATANAAQAAPSPATSNRRRRRRFWRIRITPRLGLFRICSPRRLLVRLRDAYVKMMLSFANSSVFSGGFAYGGDVPARVGFGKGPLKEYDERVIVEIYKTLVAQGQLMAKQGGTVGGGGGGGGKLPQIAQEPA